MSHLLQPMIPGLFGIMHHADIKACSCDTDSTVYRFSLVHAVDVLFQSVKQQRSSQNLCAVGSFPLICIPKLLAD